MTIKLYLEEISLDKGVNGDTLILRQRETFSSYGERNLTLLEVEVSRCEDGDYCFGWIGRIEGTVGGRCAVVEIAFRNTVDSNDGSWYVGCYVDNYLTISQHICFGQVVSQEKNNLDRSCISHWQFYRALHRMQLHLLYVTCGLVYIHCSAVSLS